MLKLEGWKALCSMSNRVQTGPQPSFSGSSSQRRNSAALEIRLRHYARPVRGCLSLLRSHRAILLPAPQSIT